VTVLLLLEEGSPSLLTVGNRVARLLPLLLLVALMLRGLALLSGL
jgi:hypothetical protein